MEGWRERALCQQVGVDAFFPEKGANAGPVKRVCAACPVRVQCLDYALERDERFGIWGGMSERERRRLQGRTSGHPTPTTPAAA